MKTLYTYIAILLYAILPVTIYAQNGGMNVGSLNVSSSVEVGTASSSVTLLSELVSLPPLTNSDIAALCYVPEGSMAYSSDSDVLIVFDGVYWKRLDGENDTFLTPPCDCDFKDYDGNTFQGVQIGEQCWMKQNLKVTHYPNGDPVPLATATATWASLGNNNIDDGYSYHTGYTYGLLYTYAAAIADNWTRDNEYTINGEGAQGICPDGWHLPTDADWKILEGNVDTQYGVGNAEWDNTGDRGLDAGRHLKNLGGWDNLGNGINSSEFSAYPDGMRSTSGTYSGYGNYGYWWTATEFSATDALRRQMSYLNNFVNRNNFDKAVGYSIRCLRN